jgi:hypothetical protein
MEHKLNGLLSEKKNYKYFFLLPAAATNRRVVVFSFHSNSSKFVNERVSRVWK